MTDIDAERPQLIEDAGSLCAGCTDRKGHEDLRGSVRLDRQNYQRVSEDRNSCPR